MRIWLLLILAAVKGEERRICFAPVVCSVGETSTTEWVEFDLQRQCEKNYREEDNFSEVLHPGSQNNLNESQIRSLMLQYTGAVGTHLKNLTYSLFNKTQEKIEDFQNKLEDLNENLKMDSEELRSQVTNLTNSVNETNKKMREIEDNMEILNRTTRTQAEDLQSQVINYTNSKFNESTEQMRELQTRLDTLNSTTEQNFGRLRSHLENLTQSLFNRSNDRLEELKMSLKNNYVNCREVNGSFFLGKCYWFIFKRPHTVLFSRAETLCAAEGGEPGDVLNEFHYNMIEGMAQTTMPDVVQIIWTGMKYNVKTNGTITRAGKELSFSKWRPGYPTPDAHNEGVLLSLSQGPSPYSGMRNAPYGWGYFGVLCQG